MYRKHKTRGAALLLAIVVLAVAALPAFAGEGVSLKGKFIGQGNDFHGYLHGIGPFIGLFDDTTFTAVWTLENGDTITNQTTSFVFGEEVRPGIVRYEQTLLITGGTGAYEDAAGEALVKGLFKLSTGAYNGRITGTISVAGP